MQAYLVHLGYALMLIALLARDILWLRGLLVIAQGLLAYYAWYRGIQQIAIWNLLFVLINGVWVVRILRERRAVTVPSDLRTLYAEYFSALPPPEFLRFWSWAERLDAPPGLLVREGERPSALYFLLRGEVRVHRGAQVLTRLGAGNFIAEMSVLTGEHTSADVSVIDGATLMRWPLARLQQARERDPALWTRVQSVLGHDLVLKLQRSAAVTASAAADVAKAGA